jgi:hypothetical protein
MEEKSNKFSLTKLYKNEHIRNLIWDILTEDFDAAFERIIRDLKDLNSGLVVQANKNREFIKEMVIEYGHKMETVFDMKKIIDKISYSHWPESECSITSENDK